jgi:hypothetical protein
VWHQDDNDKCMFLDGEPRPCIIDSMRYGLEIIKGISGSLNNENNCVKRTSSNMFGTHVNH